MEILTIEKILNINEKEINNYLLSLEIYDNILEPSKEYSKEILQEESLNNNSSSLPSSSSLNLNLNDNNNPFPSLSSSSPFFPLTSSSNNNTPPPPNTTLPTTTTTNTTITTDNPITTNNTNNNTHNNKKYEDILNKKRDILINFYIENKVYFNIVYELRSNLFEVYDLIQILIINNENKLNFIFIENFIENYQLKLKETFQCILIKNNNYQFQIFYHIINKNNKLIIMDLNDTISTIFDDFSIFINNIYYGKRITSNYLNFGYNHLKLCYYDPKIKKITITNSMLFVSSFLYSYTVSLDRCIDYLYWCWDGNWTDELESSILELLISVNDDLFEFIRQMKNTFQGMSAGVDELDELFQTVQEDLRLVLTTHSKFSLGRLHQTFLQFLEMTSGVTSAFVKIPQAFIQAIEKFIYYKIAASPLQPLLNEISKLVSLNSFFFFFFSFSFSCSYSYSFSIYLLIYNFSIILDIIIIKT